MKHKLNLKEEFEVVEITKGDIIISLTFTKEDYVDRDKVSVKLASVSGKDRGMVIKPCKNNKIEIVLDKTYEDYIRAIERKTGEKYKF